MKVRRDLQRSQASNAEGLALQRTGRRRAAQRSGGAASARRVRGPHPPCATPESDLFAVEDPFLAPTFDEDTPPYACQFTLDGGGVFDVRSMDLDSVPQAAAVLLESGLLRGAYATSQQMEAYLNMTLGVYPRGGFLVGRVLPRRDAKAGGPPPPVVATVGFSLTQDTRKKDAALPAPPQAGYVSELAVSGACRRRGYAKLMLRAAEQLTAQLGRRGLSLHVRLDKPELVALYTSQDYGTLRTEGFGLRRRLYRRALMYKELAMADEQ